mmetsp:Transcript_767/g.1844  ORF Transcript_767/g.1844 Transcript_767/m.1844 type:complete len:168 (+) Transcript_767:490-993(+)|eukprot:CAMPEP_0119558244 /NCGR_PEP_ID=MMETSP1352-20130426/10424_1 /TAXON_ID=265584 /ORGANISM="Stauroneis constricta, Strain CCMP1120" /LENGTH=167 /DNA_ID=CAMNT_0007605539 /DNA_START=467 /DNA_END=970 /DNA_ORIENTATION=+
MARTNNKQERPDRSTSITIDDIPKRGVQFHGENSIRQVEEIARVSQNFTESERFNMWGDSVEFQERRAQLHEDLHQLKMGRRSSNDEYTRLGLTDKIGEGRKEKKLNRQSAVSAVLDEQDLQCEEGKRDDELLADIYYSSTYKSAKKAQQDAQRIREEVDESDHSEE